MLHAFSPSVLPPPADWPVTVHTTGYWFLPRQEEALPPQLRDFLLADDPPVFVGFGSMSGRDPSRSTALVLEAARRAGKRLAIGAGWGGLDSSVSGDGVFVVEDVDYLRLFPAMAAVVHHGGAGTTGTAFASGRPQVVCPFIADQPFWARLAHHRGVAPAPQPQRHLTAAGLAAAITTATTDPDMARAAQDLGDRVRAEDGLTAAVTTLERVAAP